MGFNSAFKGLMVIINRMLHNICVIIWRWKFRIFVMWVCFIVDVFFCVLWDDGVIVVQGFVERKRTAVYRCLKIRLRVPWELLVCSIADCIVRILFRLISVVNLSFIIAYRPETKYIFMFNPLKPELNPICYLLALLGAHHFLHVSRIRVKLLTFRLLMS